MTSVGCGASPHPAARQAFSGRPDDAASFDQDRVAVRLFLFSLERAQSPGVQGTLRAGRASREANG